MSQAQETKCLTKKQIDTTLKNWFKILGIKEYKVLSSGKPVFSKENEEKWGLQHITKFADNYTLYRADGNDVGPMFFIIIETDKFDKLNISACCWYYHIFENEVKKDSGPNVRPQVYICPAFVITDAMFLHVPVNVLPCIYRFVSLCELYPMIGSEEGLYGLTYDYEIVKNPGMPYNGRTYSLMYDKDPIVKILNALPGDVIQYKRVLSEGSPYGEYYRREVISTASNINAIAPSGICYELKE